MVANRTIGTGLTAAAVISSWLYSTALLGSSLLTYRYGVAVGVWWGAAASIMVCFFSFLSIEAKRKAPNAHTLLELIRTRYGTSAHIIWIVLCVANNILVFSAMLTGASTAVTALTGMHVIASSYLMPVSLLCLEVCFSKTYSQYLFFHRVIFIVTDRFVDWGGSIYLFRWTTSNLFDRLYPHLHHNANSDLVHP
jgi:Na+/proline symporter